VTTRLIVLGTLALVLGAGNAPAQGPPIQAPVPGVPEIYTIEGQFVRVAYNNEGYVSLGYRVANQSVGQEWLLLEIGVTVRDGQPNHLLQRDALSLETPDGSSLPLPSNQEFLQTDLRALETFAQTVSDPVNYFPPGSRKPCRIGFFADTASPGKAWDQVELNSRHACLGRLYFRVPGGIRHGQHWLNVRFANSLVRVPFRILTKEEERTFSKSWQDIKKALDEAFSQK
jgi:hypothetical protein